MSVIIHQSHYYIKFFYLNILWITTLLSTSPNASSLKTEVLNSQKMLTIGLPFLDKESNKSNDDEDANISNDVTLP